MRRRPGWADGPRSGGQVHVRVDTREVVAAASWLESEADAVRRLASSSAALGQVDGDTLDAVLREALSVAGDVCGDVLEVVGLDLDVLAAKARAGAGTYDAVERAVIRAAGGPRAAGRAW